MELINTSLECWPLKVSLSLKFPGCCPKLLCLALLLNVSLCVVLLLIKGGGAVETTPAQKCSGCSQLLLMITEQILVSCILFCHSPSSFPAPLSLTTHINKRSFGFSAALQYPLPSLLQSRIYLRNKACKTNSLISYIIFWHGGEFPILCILVWIIHVKHWRNSESTCRKLGWAEGNKW